MEKFDFKKIDKIRYERIAQGNGELLLALPEKTPASCLLFVHGGGWRSDSCERMLPHIRYAAMCGAVGASVSYRLLSDECDVRDGLQDCVRALETVREICRKRYGNLPVVAIGDSAGGYYAACLGCRRILSKLRPEAEPVAYVVDCNGITDLTGKWSYGIINKASDSSDGAETAKEFSPLFAADKGDAPVLILQGDRDKTVPLSEAEAYRDALTSKGVPVEFRVIEGAAHAFIIFGYKHDDKFVSEILRWTFEFLEQKGFF